MNARDAIIERILPELKRWRAEQQRVISNTDLKVTGNTVMEETLRFDQWMSFFSVRRAKEIV
jgi:hypothetical protein